MTFNKFLGSLVVMVSYHHQKVLRSSLAKTNLFLVAERQNTSKNAVFKVFIRYFYEILKIFTKSLKSTFLFTIKYK